jgi:hypothetical protein
MPIAWPGIGTWPDYVAAVGTVGTLAFAVGTLRRELRLQRERERAEEMRQAQLVSAWVDENVEREPTHEGHDVFDVVIRNGSDREVTSCYVALPAAFVPVPEDAFEPVLPPGTKRIPFESQEEIDINDRVQLEFVDADGRCWLKDDFGRLSRNEWDSYGRVPSRDGWRANLRRLLTARRKRPSS